jgi:transmembrane sensor
MAALNDLPSDLPLLEQAAGWFDRVTSESLSSDERDEFERWRASPDNALAYAEIEAAHAEAQGMARAPQMLALRHEALSRIVMPYARRKQRRVWISGALAASLAITLGLANWQALGGFVNGDIVSSAPTEWQQQATSYQTAVGEQLTIALPDGSSASLNTDSRLQLAYTKSERRLILVKGQALFHVAKGQARPFIVQALDRIVTAHGTTFDVRIAADRKVKVALIEGSVTVADTRKNTPPPVKLQPNHILIASDDAVTVSAEPEIEHEVSWKDGLIIFEDESLAQATEEVNRYVKTPIVLDDDRLKQIRVSGAFRTGETQAFIEALQIQFPVKVVGRENNRIVLGYRS